MSFIVLQKSQPLTYVDVKRPSYEIFDIFCFLLLYRWIIHEGTNVILKKTKNWCKIDFSGNELSVGKDISTKNNLHVKNELSVGKDISTKNNLRVKNELSAGKDTSTKKNLRVKNELSAKNYTYQHEEGYQRYEWSQH